MTVSPARSPIALPRVVAAPDFTTDEVLMHAASLLDGSAHVLEGPVRAYAHAHAIATVPAAHVETHAGHGLLGRVNGKISVLGTASLLRQAGIDLSPLATEAAMLDELETNVYFLSIGDHLAGLIALTHPK